MLIDPVLRLGSASESSMCTQGHGEATWEFCRRHCVTDQL